MKNQIVFNKEKFRELLSQSITGNVAAEARNLGISRQHLNNILKGKREPSKDLLFTICVKKKIELSSLVN